MADKPDKPTATLPSASNYPLDAAGNPILPQQNSTEGFADSDVAAFLRSIGLWKPLDPKSTEPLRRAAAEGARQASLAQAAREAAAREHGHNPHPARAGQQGKQSSERAIVAEPTSTSGQPMSPEDRRFWVWLSLWGGALLAVFAAGLALIFGGKPYPGSFLSAGSLIGIAILARWLVHRKPFSSPIIMAGMIVLTWAFIAYDVYDRHQGPQHATGKIWAPLTDEQEASLERALKAIPNHRAFRIICLSADCREFSGNIISAFYSAGWQPLASYSSTLYSEPVGLVLYLRDENDRTLANAIETSTGRKIDRIETSTDPTVESLFVGIKP